MGLGPWPTPWCRWNWAPATWRAVDDSQGPDDATHADPAGHGTEHQKGKFLKPLLAGDKRVCYSMTEKAAGADAPACRPGPSRTATKLCAEREKWFSSAANAADMALVMAMTDPDAPRHRRYSTFIAELPTPATSSQRDIAPWGSKVRWPRSWAAATPRSTSRTWSSRPRNPGRGGRRLRHGQHRLAYGRLRPRHAQCGHGQRALDLAAKQVTTRETFGELLEKRRACSGCSPTAPSNSTWPA